MKSTYEKFPFYSHKGQNNRCTWAKLKKKKKRKRNYSSHKDYNSIQEDKKYGC